MNTGKSGVEGSGAGGRGGTAQQQQGKGAAGVGRLRDLEGGASQVCTPNTLWGSSHPNL